MKLLTTGLILAIAGMSVEAQALRGKSQGETFEAHPLQIEASVTPTATLDGMSCGGSLSFPEKHGDIGSIPSFEIDIDFDMSQAAALRIPAAEKFAFNDYHSNLSGEDRIVPSVALALEPELFDPICSTLRNSPEDVTISSAGFVRRVHWTSHENSRGETIACFYGYRTEAVIDTVVGDTQIVMRSELWNPHSRGQFKTSNAEDCNEENITRLLGL